MHDVGKLEDLNGHFGLDLGLEFRVFGAEAAALRRHRREPHVLEHFRDELLDAFLVVHAPNHAHAYLRVLGEFRLFDANVPGGAKEERGL